MLFYLLTLSCNKELSYDLYHETRWDPLVFDNDLVPSDRLDAIKSVSGHFENHIVHDEPPMKKFGDISIITLNLFRDVLLESETIESAENVRTILDEAHPTFLCLQGVDDSLLLRINGKLSKQNSDHYKLANIDKFDTDMLTGQRVYLPIIYDTSLVAIKNSGYFETDSTKKMMYGSFLEIYDKRKPTGVISFTIVNIDMFSSFNDVVSAEFSNIVSDIKEYNEVASYPVIIAGGMGTMPPNVKEIIKESFINTVEKDKNNVDFPQTTVHAGGQDDGIMRDFILLRDVHDTFELNYARILREFLAGDHYPVHAIFSYKHRNVKVVHSIANDNEKDTDEERKAKTKKY